jgi:nucleoside phosphorylase
MQAMQSSPTPGEGDMIQKLPLKRVKEIPSEKITVAVFCALAEESGAMRYSLDEKFECRYKTLGPRQYIYSIGRIGEHNIVIARPTQMGPVSAALCAATVNPQFPNVRFALMVGIGAGIPSLPKRVIRLGDVVVSIPQGDHPGVLQYDFGKYVRDDKFILKGTLNKPPPILINADGSQLEDEIMEESPLCEILGNITKQRGYARPSSGDVLFDPTFHHINDGDDCSGCEASSERIVVSRPNCEENYGPVVHRGLILSGGGVVKNSEDRNRLRRGREEAICFEMEAAGIMDEIPSLVIRGICDYADTHKQDGWHYYAAAAVAAAYGKTVLLKINGQDVEETRTMQETMGKRGCEKHNRFLACG